MESPQSSKNKPPAKRTLGSSIVVGLIGALGAVYLVNPTAGIIELIPDYIPFFGNLDEAAAMMLVISALAYFGVDLGGLFGRKSKKDDVIDIEVEDR